MYKYSKAIIIFFILLFTVSCTTQEIVKDKNNNYSYGLLVMYNRIRSSDFYKFDQKKNKFLYYYPLYVQTSREMYTYRRISHPISEFLKERKIKFNNLDEDDRNTLGDYTYIEVYFCDTIDIEGIAKKEEAMIFKEKLFQVLNKKVKNYRIEEFKPQDLRFVNSKEGEEYKRILDSLNSSPPSIIDTLSF